MGFNDMPAKSRTGITIAFAASVAAIALSGCMSSPTYGTDKTSSAQLVDDMTNILQIAPKKRADIDYKPRPTLVKPGKGEAENLPAPQDDLTTASNSAWPESPEAKRARIRAEADENTDNPNFKPAIDTNMARNQVLPQEPKPTMSSIRSEDAGIISTQKQRLQSDAFRKRLAQSRQGSATSRQYLSEPPVDYRQVAENAPVGDVGEDEAVKERRLKAAAAKKKDSNWVKDLWPF